MKYINKIVGLLCVFTIVFLSFGTRVNAQTLGELEKELNDKKQELKDNQKSFNSTGNE